MSSIILMAGSARSLCRAWSQLQPADRGRKRATAITKNQGEGAAVLPSAGTDTQASPS